MKNDYTLFFHTLPIWGWFTYLNWNIWISLKGPIRSLSEGIGKEEKRFILDAEYIAPSSKIKYPIFIQEDNVLY
jgi:hypothetical protein